MRTLGISPKVWAPTAALLVTFLANWIASGEFDRTELAQIVAAGLTAVIGYLASPGTVEIDAIPGGSVPREDGYGVIEVLLAILLAVVILAIAANVLD